MLKRNDDYVCPQCGSDEVYAKMWVHLNQGPEKELAIPANDEDIKIFCFGCERYTPHTIERQEYRYVY